MERLTAVGGSRRGWIGHLALLALLLTGPEFVARMISLVTSAVTFPLTGQLRFADNRYEVFNVELLLRSGTSESSVAIDNQLEVFRAYELGLLATWETPDELICVPSFRA